MKKIVYITETSLPSTSANIINSLKFCDSLSKFNDLTLLLPDLKMNIKNLFLNYNLKYKIKIKPILNQEIDGKLKKLFFFLKLISYLSKNHNKSNFIISRSIYCSILLSFLNKKNTLEIHHGVNGFSKILFKILMISPFKKNISFIVINKNLVKDIKINKQKYIVLDDSADIFVNKIKSGNKIYKKTCVYIGSFYQGKGIEIISQLAKILPEVNFHLYGDFSVLRERNIKIKKKNIKLVKKLKYKEVNSVLKKYHIALMPYQKKIMAKSKNLEISKYISPLKMFDYLAAGNIIIASRLAAYSHILKNNVNSFLIGSNNYLEWQNKINLILNKPNNYLYIKRNAISSAKKYSWDIRAKKFLKFLNSI